MQRKYSFQEAGLASRGLSVYHDVRLGCVGQGKISVSGRFQWRNDTAQRYGVWIWAAAPAIMVSGLGRCRHSGGCCGRTDLPPANRVGIVFWRSFFHVTTLREPQLDSLPIAISFLSDPEHWEQHWQQIELRQDCFHLMAELRQD